jgi:hypothetical protein
MPTSEIRTGLSDELRAWAQRDEPATLGSLIELFGNRAFAIVFVLLLGVPALPLPTGGATHLFEIVAIVLALQMIAGREEIWLPSRWRQITLATEGRFIAGMLKGVRTLERVSRPRGAFVFHPRAANSAIGLLIAIGAIVAFLAPPFTGLDTLPALGAVLIALGVLMKDLLIVIIGAALEAAGTALVVIAGAAAIHGLSNLL